jgi:hypothetical protein
MEEENKLMEEFDKYIKIEIGENLLKNNTEKVFKEIKENITKD